MADAKTLRKLLSVARDAGLHVDLHLEQERDRVLRRLTIGGTVYQVPIGWGLSSEPFVINTSRGLLPFTEWEVISVGVRAELRESQFGPMGQTNDHELGRRDHHSTDPLDLVRVPGGTAPLVELASSQTAANTPAATIAIPLM